ncbi:MAG: hypothetical protein WCK49_08285 [Myxococcaceae bacterium]
MVRSGQIVLFAFPQTDLHQLGRLAIQEQSLFSGSIGEIHISRLNRIRQNLSFWINPYLKKQ